MAHGRRRPMGGRPKAAKQSRGVGGGRPMVADRRGATSVVLGGSNDSPLGYPIGAGASMCIHGGESPSDGRERVVVEQIRSVVGFWWGRRGSECVVVEIDSGNQAGARRDASFAQI